MRGHRYAERKHLESIHFSARSLRHPVENILTNGRDMFPFKELE